MQGKLIVFEGLDGAGKTTQIELLSSYLKEKGFPVIITSWNSSRLISKAIKRAKKAQLLTPYLYSTLHAADFMYRLENIILPALQEGYIVIADRYIFTALARDIVRNIDRSWIENNYSLAPRPDLSFYCKTSIEETLERVIAKRGGEQPHYYESGMDIIHTADPQTAFRKYQSMVASEYDRIQKEYDLIEIDTSGAIDNIHRYVISIVDEYLKNQIADKNVRSEDYSLISTRVVQEKKGINKPAIGKNPDVSGNSAKGKLVIIESADKQAAERQANLLYNELIVRGYNAKLALLGHSWISIGVAQKIMKKTVLSLPVKILLSMSELALYYEQVITPALQSGAVVIMDGYLADLFIGYTVSGLLQEWFSSMYRVFDLKADCTIFLDTSSRELVKKKSFRTLLNIPGYSTDEHLYDAAMQQKIIEMYRNIAKKDQWQEAPSNTSEIEIHKFMIECIEKKILPQLKQGSPNESLREVFEFFSRFENNFEHSRQVAGLANTLFDQTMFLHGYTPRERLLLEYAAYLHDIGHALSEDRHEEFTYEAIMRQKFKSIFETDKEIIANIACLHRQPFAKMKFQYLSRLGGENQLMVKRLASLLRIADALDESGRRLVQDVRCYDEHGVIYVDLHCVSKARQERAAVLRKSDMFERVYQKSTVVVRNWLEKRARQEQKQQLNKG